MTVRKCEGGPLDGGEVADRGWLFRPVGIWSGVYERDGDRYRWRPLEG